MVKDLHFPDVKCAQSLEGFKSGTKHAYLIPKVATAPAFPQ